MAKKRKGRPGTAQDEQEADVPRSFVLRKGSCGRPLKQLVKDMRHVMMPNTAKKLKERRQNTIKDYQNVCGPLGISHMLVFSSTSQGTTYLRAMKAPQGPTLTFRVNKFCLVKDIINHQARPHSPGVEFLHPPLVVMNNFPSDSIRTLVSTTFQTLFPPINIQKTKLKDCRRIVLFDFNPETEEISFRHYLVKVAEKGVSRSVRRIVKRHILPQLGDLDDISDLVNTENEAYDSEAEDDSDAEVTVTQDSSRREAFRRAKRARDPQQCAVRLKELGPRMQLQLMKVQQGFCAGEALFKHAQDHSSDGFTEAKRPMSKELRQKKRESEMKRIESLAPTIPEKALRNLKQKRAVLKKDRPENALDEDGLPRREKVETSVMQRMESLAPSKPVKVGPTAVSKRNKRPIKDRSKNSPAQKRHQSGKG